MIGNFESLGYLAPRGVQFLRAGATEYWDLGEGEPLVIVPGLAGGMGLIYPLVEKLSQHFRVITYQLRAENDVFHRGYGLDNLACDLEELIHNLGLERPGLMGVSFGGAVALEYAARHPGELAFLALQGTGARYAPGIFGNVLAAVLNRLALPVNHPFINQFFSLLLGGHRRQGDRFDFVVQQCWQTDQSVMAYRMDLLEKYDVAGKLWAMRAPTLVIRGERDVMVSEEDARTLCQHLPLARFATIPDAGHFAFVSHISEVANQLLQFEYAMEKV